MYSPELRDDAFCFGLNFNISKLVYWLLVISGVRQGSILGPLFFTIFINDLPGVISANNELALYADDSKVFKLIKTIDDQESFQHDRSYSNY